MENHVFEIQFLKFEVRDLKLMIDLRSWTTCRDQEVVISANPVIVITRASSWPKNWRNHILGNFSKF